MPAIAPVTINDGAASPVAHTFTPLGKDDKGVYWFEQTTPTPTNILGAKRIGYSQNRITDPKSALTGYSLVTLSVSLPTLETLGNTSAGITPPPTVAYTEVARISFRVAERSTTQERKDTRVLMANLLAHAMTVAAVDTLQPTY